MLHAVDGSYEGASTLWSIVARSRSWRSSAPSSRGLKTHITPLPITYGTPKHTTVKAAMAAGDCYVTATIRRHVALFSYQDAMAAAAAAALTPSLRPRRLA